MDPRENSGDRTNGKLPSERVVEAVSTVTGKPPTDFEPLYYVVDPDSLNRLFSARERSSIRPGSRITFSIASCDVTVHDDGRILVRDASGESNEFPLSDFGQGGHGPPTSEG
jgi:hypothetical protein